MRFWKFQNKPDCDFSGDKRRSTDNFEHIVFEHTVEHVYDILDVIVNLPHDVTNARHTDRHRDGGANIRFDHSNTSARG